MHRRYGFAWLELVIVILVVVVFIALIIPAVQQSREAARRSCCKNNLKQLGIALQSYHETYTLFPPLRTGTAYDCEGYHGNYSDQWSGSSAFHPAHGDRAILSGFIGMMPFIDCSPLWDYIASAPCQGGDPSLSGNGSKTFPHPDYDIPCFVCPSSSPLPERDWNTAGSRRSYCFSIGDQYLNVNSVTTQNRGVFSSYVCRSISEIVDGTSHTIMLAERDIGRKTSQEKPGQIVLWAPLDPTAANGCHNRNRGTNALLSDDGRSYNGATVVDPDRGLPLLPGEQWANGLPFFSAVTIVTPPNSPSCTESGPFDDDLLISVSSRHHGGAHVLFADGSTRFISDDIDTNRPASNLGESKFGVWGAMGSIAGQEDIEGDLGGF